jgi:hypothetical protein
LMAVSVPRDGLPPPASHRSRARPSGASQRRRCPPRCGLADEALPDSATPDSSSPTKHLRASR